LIVYQAVDPQPQEMPLRPVAIRDLSESIGDPFIMSCHVQEKSLVAETLETVLGEPGFA
jgi:hypothetical protein